MAKQRSVQSRIASRRERNIEAGVGKDPLNTQKNPGDRQESRHVFQERGSEDYSGDDVTVADKIVHGEIPSKRPEGSGAKSKVAPASGNPTRENHTESQSKD